MILKDKQIQILKKIVNKLILHLNSNKFQSSITNKNLKNWKPKTLSKNALPAKKILKLIYDYLNNTISTHHPHFFNQLFSGFNFYSFLAEIITSATNTSMYTFEVSPIQTMIEVEIINQISTMIGFDKSLDKNFNKRKTFIKANEKKNNSNFIQNSINGTFVSGGSNANLIALAVAREDFQKRNTEKKININQLRVYVSEHSHYSFEKAMIISGIGLGNLVKIKSNSKEQMDVLELKKEILQDIQKNKKPFLIGATSGTTVPGSFDDIFTLTKVAKKYNIWLHVDGSLGGAVIFSKKYKKELLNGLEKADSFCFDAHKMLGVSLICSVLLFKNEKILKKVNQVKADYLFHHEELEASCDLGEYSFQCGRKAEAVKFWLSWCSLGENGYQKRIENFFALAKWCEQKIKKSPNLELIYPVFSVTVCFRFIGKNNQDNEIINQMNLKIRQELIFQNLYMVNFTKEKRNNHEILFIRLVIINVDLTKKILTDFFKKVEIIGKSFF